MLCYDAYVGISKHGNCLWIEQCLHKEPTLSNTVDVLWPNTYQQHLANKTMLQPGVKAKPFARSTVKGIR
jgi:hypothetical protein